MHGARPKDESDDLVLTDEHGRTVVFDTAKALAVPSTEHRNSKKDSN